MIHNERIKLLATALNNLGVGSIIAGLVAPIVNSHFSIGVAVWSSVGIGLICLAQLILGEAPLSLEIYWLIVAPALVLGLGALAYWASGKIP